MAGMVPMVSACVLAPPIEPEPPEPNLPPFLDFMSPSSPVVTINDDAPVTLSVRPFDPNDEDNLFFVWIGDEIPVTEGITGPEPGVELRDGVFHRYLPIERTFDPCGEDLRGVERTSIRVYAADRDIQIRSETEIVTEEGGFLDSWVWDVGIRPEACDR